jgi:FkbM family methyltransferase
MPDDEYRVRRHENSISFISPRCFLCEEPWEYMVHLEGHSSPIYLCESHLQFVRGCECWDRVVSAERVYLPTIDEYEEEEGYWVSNPEHDWEKHYQLKSGDVFVEAGSFKGSYAELASSRVGSSGRVILIEADNSNYSDILGLVKTRGLSNVTVLKKAVWSSRGKEKLYQFGGLARCGLVVKAISRKCRCGWYQRLKVKEDGVPDHWECRCGNYPATDIKYRDVETDTIDNILPELGIDHVDLISGDIEGSEVEMVKGMEKFLDSKRISNVAIATYHFGGAMEEISKILREKGYEVYDYIRREGVLYAHV